MNDTGLERGKITKYLSVLRELHIIERRVPVAENSPKSSKKGIYLLKDNYFKFWFRFVFENTGSALSLKIPNISSRTSRKN